MAPRTAARRERDNVDYSAIGKLGRRTGVMLEPRPLDANGMEEISGIFSSPRKPSPLRKSTRPMDSVEEASSSLTPSQALSARRSSRGPSLPPRSASPRKTGISGTARRSNGVDILAAGKERQRLDPDNDEITPQSTPSRTIPSARRFHRSPEDSPLREITVPNVMGVRGERRGEDHFDPRGPVSASIEHDGMDGYRLAIQELKAVPILDDTSYVPAMGGDEENIRSDQDMEDASEPELPPNDFDDEEADRTFDPEAAETPRIPEPAQANSRKKRKSDAVARSVPADESPTPKRTKRMNENRAKNAPMAPNSQPSSSHTRPKGRPPLTSKDNNIKMSSAQEKELEDIIERVKARPGQNKSLYILRRETPADEGMTHTRSGRVSVKPLAYWRNERCVYGGSPGGASFADGARFPLNSIKEIVRTEEIDTRPAHKKSKQKGKRAQRKASKTADDSESSDSDPEADADADGIVDADAEPWETDIGTFRGPVSVWNQQAQAPTEEEKDVDIAHAAAAIQTREVRGSTLHEGPTFRFAKLLSTKFFGTGIVDLPPGGVKRPKNSRKMHMTFFVVKGRVTVQVGPIGREETGSLSKFSIGKGGFWQVPRGNQYSIENEHAKPARIFFSQGCEPPPVEDEA